MFVTNCISTTKIQKISEITNFFRHYFLSRTEVEDGSYLRVKDISLSYDVPRKLISRFGLTRLQPYVSATNLLTLTDYSGMDPEVNQYGNSGSVQGIDWGTYPLNKSVVLGVKVEF